MMISQLRGLSRLERWRGWQSANFLWPMAISMSNCLPRSTLWKVLDFKLQVRCKIDVFEAKKNKIRKELFVTSLYKLFLSLLRQYFPTHSTHFNFDQEFSLQTSNTLYIIIFTIIVLNCNHNHQTKQNKTKQKVWFDLNLNWFSIFDFI